MCFFLTSAAFSFPSSDMSFNATHKPAGSGSPRPRQSVDRAGNGLAPPEAGSEGDFSLSMLSPKAKRRIEWTPGEVRRRKRPRPHYPRFF